MIKPLDSLIGRTIIVYASPDKREEKYRGIFMGRVTDVVGDEEGTSEMSMYEVMSPNGKINWVYPTKCQFLAPEDLTKNLREGY